MPRPQMEYHPMERHPRFAQLYSQAADQPRPIQLMTFITGEPVDDFECILVHRDCRGRFIQLHTASFRPAPPTYTPRIQVPCCASSRVSPAAGPSYLASPSSAGG